MTSKPSYDELERRLRVAEAALAASQARESEASSRALAAPRPLAGRVEAILQAAMDGFWISDRGGRFVAVNDAYAALVGYSRDELLAMSIGDVEANESPEDVAAHIAKVLQHGRDRFVTRHRRKDGTLVDAEISAHYLADDDCFFVFVRDVTERLRVERALRSDREGLESEARERTSENALLRIAIEQAPVAVVMTDSRGRIELVNPAFEAMTRFTRHEVLGRNPRILKSGLHDGAFYRRMWDALSSGRTWRGEVTNRRKDGALYVQELAIAPVTDGQGGLRFVGVGHDVTEAKRLRESLEMTQFAVDHSTDMVFWLNPDGRFVYGNESALVALGLARDELLARSLWDVSAAITSDRWPATWDAVAQSGSLRTEDEVRRRDGSSFPAEVVVTHVRFGGSELECAIVRDLTERRRSEQALRDSERMLVESQRVARIGSYRTDLVAGTWTSSEVLDEIFGIVETTFTRDVPGWLSLVHPDDRDTMAAYLTDHVVGGRGRFDREYRIVRRSDGAVRWMHGLGELVLDDGGRPVTLIGTIQDITERKRAQAVLRDTEVRLSAIVDTAVNGIITVDACGIVESVNPAAERLFGYRAEEILGRDVSLLMPSFGARSRDGTPRMGLDSDQPPTSHELVGRRKDGTELPVAVSFAELDLGRARAFAGIIRDLTAERAAQRALATSEERHRALLRGLPDLIFVLDRDGRVHDYYTNETRLLSSPPQSVLGRSLREVLPDEVAGRLEAAFEVALRTGETQSVEYTCLVEAETRAFDARVVPTETKRVTVVTRDVTQGKSLEAQLLQAQKMEAVGLLAGGIAHDFNNILTVIFSFAGFVTEGLVPHHPAHEDLKQVVRAAERAADLVQQLLAFSRRQITQSRVLSLNDLVLATGKLLQRVLGEDIELVTTTDPDLWLTRIDPGRFEQVLVNLAVNARDAMPGGGTLTVSTRNVVLDADDAATHRDARVGEHVVLTVSDSGTGMGPDVLARVFEPFFTTKEVGRGTGLGLSTCYGIVKQAGGHIEVHSEPGRGTTFRIYLRRSLGSDADEIAPRAASVPAGRETILVVEDDASVRASVVRVLRKLGYEVLDSTTTTDALRIATERAERIDLLITDVVMPKLNGPELAERITSCHPETKVLYMSGHTNDAIVHQGELRPGVAFIEKPFVPDALARKIRETLDAPQTST